jgi:hypothetical protein
MTTATTATATAALVLVGDDGYRPVVWGLGAAADEDTAEDDAREDARDYLDGVVDDVDAEVAGLRVVIVDAATARAIEDGEVDAVALGLV